MSRLTSRLLLALLATIAVLLPGAPAWAHNSLAEATPAKNATLKKPPTTVELRFLQKLNPTATKITIVGVEASAPEIDGPTATITFDPLPNGTYTVAYDVISKDGHPVKGSYKFTVTAPTPVTTSPSAAPSPTTEAPTPAAPPSAAPATPAALVSDEGSSNTGIWIAALVAGVLLVAGGVFLTLRRRRS
ncbi:copper resistance CopC family protein [Actinoplanes sp. NPDC049596]|uniref:copper resistance CopC family protein n=1 Tax=unclassified Actinoplanes TaxID=2626549 RepID=UPI00343E71DA